MTVRHRWLASGAGLLVLALNGIGTARDETTTTKPLRIVVMDPLADRLACDCVKGHAQRKYDEFARFLEQRLGRPVQITYGGNLPDAVKRLAGPANIIIGKHAVVSFDAARTATAVRPIARLTDGEGRTDLTGWFVVRQKDPARSLADLAGRQILFGPPESDEKHAAALAALKAADVPVPEKIETRSACSSAALAVAERDADAAVISSYAYPLLEGCRTIDRGALRVIGKTSPVPFVTVFATAALTSTEQRAFITALAGVRTDAKLLRKLESRDGFVRIPPPVTANAPAASSGWTDWRGTGRAAHSPDVPCRLPAQAKFLWKRPLSGAGLSGIAATTSFVIVADKENETHDVFRCLAADSGDELWKLAYAAAGRMDYSNSPRATPVIHEGLVYLLGAFGHLHCVELESGMIVWKRHLCDDFNSKLVTWGFCATPLIVDDRLIVNPGAPDAALVALDRRTGKVLWKSPGAPSAYASFIVGRFGGVRQIVGYDAESLGGWNPRTGTRLWKLVPPHDAFNVPTPIDVGGKLLVTTENNGTRLYGFDARGHLRPKPLAKNLDLAPDSSTPVVVNNLVFGCRGALYCLDLADRLRIRWSAEDDVFDDYASFIAGNGHVLITTTDGELLLVRADPGRYQLAGRLRLFAEADIWSHPALVGKRLYVRSDREIGCVRLD